MNSIRIVLSGDNHLGKRQYNSLVRERDFQKAWLWVCDEVAKANPDFFIMSGDLFDKKQIRDPITLSVAMDGLAQAGGNCKVVAIEGNHDGRSIIHKGRSWLEFLYKQGLVDHILRREDGVFNSGLAIFGLPWAGRSTPEAFDTLVWNMETYGDAEEFKVGVLHAAPEGYVMGAGTVPAEDLLGSKFDLILMGHCHKSFNIKDKIICAGSPEVCDIGEIDNGGGIWVIDIDLDTKKKTLELIKYKPRGFSTYTTTCSSSDGMDLFPTPQKESVIVLDIIGERRPVDFLDIKKFIHHKYEPISIRLNDKMSAKAEIKPKSGPEHLASLLADLLGKDATADEFNSVFDCFESKDSDAIEAILLEVLDDK